MFPGARSASVDGRVGSLVEDRRRTVKLVFLLVEEAGATEILFVNGSMRSSVREARFRCHGVPTSNVSEVPDVRK